MMTDAKGTMQQDRKAIMDACIKSCLECLEWCNRCAAACIGGSGGKMSQTMADCAKLCLDCADACAACATVCARGSERAGVLARACAELCAACATACDAGCAEGCSVDDVMRRCAQACRTCAENCRQMAA